MELNERYEQIAEQIKGTDVQIHVMMVGSEEDVHRMGEELGLSFPVQAMPDVEIHSSFGLTYKDKEGVAWPNRGYAIVHEGLIAEAQATDDAGERALDLVQKVLELE